MSDVYAVLIPAVSSLLGGGLIVGLFRLRPERQNLIAEANERSVRSLMASMDDLEERLEDAQKREAELLNELAKLRAEVIALRKDLHERRTELVALAVERDAWKQRALDSGYTPE